MLTDFTLNTFLEAGYSGYLCRPAGLHSRVASCWGAKKNPPSALATVEAVQRLRAASYRSRNLIQPEAVSYPIAQDAESYHLVVYHEAQLCATIALRLYQRNISLVASSLLAVEVAQRSQAQPYLTALQQWLTTTAASHSHFVEISGWMSDRQQRSTLLASLFCLVGAFAFCRQGSGLPGLTIARTSNRTADLLQRLGAEPLSSPEPLPDLYDSFYQGKVRFLQFRPNHHAQQLTPAIQETIHYLNHQQIIVT